LIFQPFNLARACYTSLHDPYPPVSWSFAIFLSIQGRQSFSNAFHGLFAWGCFGGTSQLFQELAKVATRVRVHRSSLAVAQIACPPVSVSIKMHKKKPGSINF
jgi:hypothetical protein